MLTTLEPFLTVTSPYRGYLTDEILCEDGIDEILCENRIDEIPCLCENGIDEILCEDGNYIQIETADYYIALQVLTSYFDPILKEV